MCGEEHTQTEYKKQMQRPLKKMEILRGKTQLLGKE